AETLEVTRGRGFDAFEVEVAGLGQATAQHERLGVEGLLDVREPDAGERGGVVYDAERHAVAGPRALEDLGGGERAAVGVGGVPRDRASGRDRLQAARVPVAAHGPSGQERHVTDLAGQAVGTA